jgi:hypothetical protein
MQKSVFRKLVILFSICFTGVMQAQAVNAQNITWTESLLDSFQTGLGIETFDVEFYADDQNDGAIILARATENFALNKTALDNKDADASAILDGNISTFWTSGTVNDIGYYIIIDLKAVRLVERVNILGSILDPLNKRVKGYLLEVGLDRSSWTTVASNDNNTDQDIFINFEPVQTRYVRITITKSDQLNWTFIGDVEIYGSGHASAGYYISKTKDLGQVVNFEQAHWQAEIPPETELTLQFRTDSTEVMDEQVIIEDTTFIATIPVVPGSEMITNLAKDTLFVRNFDYTIDYKTGKIIRTSLRIGYGVSLLVTYRGWGEWSPEYQDGNGVLFQVIEPRQYVQYKANLRTLSLETPKLNEISIEYSTAPVAHRAEGSTRPSEVVILKPTRLTYRLDFQFDEFDSGCDTLRVSVPSAAKVQEIRLQDQPLPELDYVDLSTTRMIVVAFAQSIKVVPSAELEVDFDITLFLSENNFPATIHSTATPANPQYVEESPLGWFVGTTGIPEKPLVSVEVKPNPFSPNGDGVFDQTTISFYVAKIAITRLLSVKIFNLNGDLVRILREELAPAGPPEPQITWDGRNTSGSLVLPGPYLVQVRLQTDAGDEVVTKTVVVAY